MGYKIQSLRWGYRFVQVESIAEEAWESRKRMDTDVDLELDAKQAIKCVRRDADLSRVIRSMRAVNECGHVIARYEPEEDMRLPGCRWRAITRIAEKLCGRAECVGEKFWCDWETNGRQDQSLVEFFVKAEEQLPDTDGFWYDLTYQDLMDEVKKELRI